MLEEKKKLSRKDVTDFLNKIIKLFQKKKFRTLKDKIDEKAKKQSKKTEDSLQESLDYLQVCVKYTLFDLEATRRENEALKKLLRDNGIEL